MFEKLSKHPLITGSFLLTLTGLISRLIGFFYRIYLSRIFGEEGMGIYQLLNPILALSFSLTAAGFQTTISKFVAEENNDNEHPRRIIRPMTIGLSICLPASIVASFLCIQLSDYISMYFLGEPRTASLLRIVALSFPLSTLHACINGYFYGRKKAMVPALCQIIEQISRVASVYLCSISFLSKGQNAPLSITVLGLVIGELISTIISCAFFLFTTKSSSPDTTKPTQQLTYKRFMFMVLPLIANRVTINALQSLETISLPTTLKQYGYDHATALSVYGVLTGMAFPLIFFPNAVTGSIAVLLLPLISQESARGNTREVRKLTIKTIQYCSLLGFFCMGTFLLFGNALGNLLFQSKLAGIFIAGLSYICPFIYLNSTLSAILQGMGKVITLFVINVLSLLLRLFFIYHYVPTHGIQGYLWGLLAGQIFTTITYLATILKKKNLATHSSKW